MPGQVFSRVHVADIARGVVAALDAPEGAYNLADDLPTGQNAVIEEACRLLGVSPPPLLPLEDAGLSPQARAFYADPEYQEVSRHRRSGASGGRMILQEGRADTAAPDPRL